MRNNTRSKDGQEFWLYSVLASFLVLIGLAFLFWRWRFSKTTKDGQRNPSASDYYAPSGTIGLTEEEAAARQPDLDIDEQLRAEDRIFLRAAIRQSLVSIYNVDLFGIAIILFLLGNPLGAIGTLLIVFINLLLNVFQEMYTKKKLNQIVKELRPQAAVIRDGVIHSIDPAMIVEGDCLLISAGDEFLVDGTLIRDQEIEVEQITDSGRGSQSKKNVGDQVKAGSYCLEGHTIYCAEEAGIQYYLPGTDSKLHLLLGELTPLQRFIEFIFRILFGIVVVFALLLIVDSLFIQGNLINTVYQDAFSIIFGIAPTSLFFILIITYAVGVLRISERGALVYRAQSIEALADASVLCISEESLVSGLRVDLNLYQPPAGYRPLSENLIHRMLGDFVHSLPNLNKLDQMLCRALPGETHSAMEVAPFLLDKGWHGIAFNEPELRGTFILGLPQIVEANMLKDPFDLPEEAGLSITKARQGIKRWLRRFNRRGGRENGEQQSTLTFTDKTVSSRQTNGEHVNGNNSRLQTLISRVDLLLSPIEDQGLFVIDTPEIGQEVNLIFAYLPEPEPLYDYRNEPRLPRALVPLTGLSISVIVRPEAGQTLLGLLESGLKVKMLSADAPESAASTAQELGLPQEQLALVSGDTLERINEEEFFELVREGNVLGNLKPSQKAAVIDSLRGQGERIVMVGTNVGDVPALQAADLRVALRNSTRAALKITDIVLLKDSLDALPTVLFTGQRLVNGILDVFKLYLSQATAQLLLLFSVLIFGLEEFPYHPTQAAVISAFTIAIPAVFLSVWAAGGRTSSSTIRRQLAYFVIPLAVTLAILTWGVYAFFVNQTQDEQYARLAVTYALLMAGWLRVLFVQPPTQFWVGGAPLRGDRRIIAVVVGSIMLFLLIISIPLLQELLRIRWLRSTSDYVLIIVSVAAWALITRAIWRSSFVERHTVGD